MHIFTCRCVFVISQPLHLFLTGTPQAEWTGYTPLSLGSPYSSSVSLFASCSSVHWNKTSTLEWLNISLLTLCPLPFFVESFQKKFEFYLFNNFCYLKEYLIEIAQNSTFLLGSFFLLGSTAATSNYSTAGRAAHTGSTGIALPFEQIQRKISLLAFLKSLLERRDSSFQLPPP